jgi:tRNA threonylcarbamoyladenosine biosynthesis protein TsaE
MSSASFATHSLGETHAFGAALAEVLEPGVVLVLTGGLGAGKTALVQGIARGLGVEERVTSPTFTMVATHRTDGRRGINLLLHADLYRVSSGAEADDLAIAELVEDAAVACVEWGDLAPEVLGNRRASICIELGVDDDDRRFIIDPGALDDAALRAALAGWAA